jgi:membrane protease YdiL (CAAX protease family)
MSAYVPPPPRPDVPYEEAQPDPTVATWQWWEAVIASVIAWVIGGLAVLPLVALMHPSANDPLGGDALFIATISNAVTLGALILWLRSAHPGWVQVIGWPSWPRVLPEIAIGAGLGILVRIASGIAATLIVFTLRGVSDRSVDLPTQVSTSVSGWGVVAFAVFAVIAAPVLEEFVFRGLLFRSIADRHGFWPGALVSAFAFGAFHLLTPGAELDVLALGLTHVGTGIGLAWIYWRRKNLLASIAGHAVFNLIAVIAIVTGLEVT